MTLNQMIRFPKSKTFNEKSVLDTINIWKCVFENICIVKMCVKSLADKTLKWLLETETLVIKCKNNKLQ